MFVVCEIQLGKNANLSMSFRFLYVYAVDFEPSDYSVCAT